MYTLETPPIMFETISISLSSTKVFFHSTDSSYSRDHTVISKITAPHLHNYTTEQQQEAHRMQLLHTRAITHIFVRRAGLPTFRAEHKPHPCYCLSLYRIASPAFTCSNTPDTYTCTCTACGTGKRIINIISLLMP